MENKQQENGLFAFIKLLLIIGVLILAIKILSACNSKSSGVQKQGKTVCFAIIHTRDSVNLWSFPVRTIWISEVEDGKNKWDTAFQYATKFRYDSTGLKKDTAGKPLIYATDSLMQIGKDSVKWSGIEGVSIDSLLRTFRPRGWKAPKVVKFAPPK